LILREFKLIGRKQRRLHASAVAMLTCLAGATGCQQQMASQPSYRPLVRSNFFADRRASRPLVAGTVSRDASEIDPLLISGRKAARSSAPIPSPGNVASISPQLSAGIRPDEFVAEFPIPITQNLLARGQERYTVYCAICHDASGTGNGKIVQRGFTRPPSYLTDNSRQLARSGYRVPLSEVPVGYLFDVATNGYGAMADYSQQVSSRDRWAIAAYIRTLQRSQNMMLDELPPRVRIEAVKALETTP
jgi:mono/diheme cytochrome c family protein